MAGTMSAHLQGTSVLTRTLAEGYCNITELLYSHYREMSACALQLAAVTHLIILGLAEVWPGSWAGSQGFPQILAISSLFLVVAALTQSEPGTSATRLRFDDQQPDITELGSGHSPFMLSAREVALERQSQRLVEIADTAVRTRGEAEQRGQAWAELMSQVSHELRTPLNAVIGFSDVMNAELFGPVGHPRYREYIEHIRDSGRSLLKSAEDTLALTALLAQPGSISSPEVLELEDFATEAWAFVALEGTARHLQMTAHGLDGVEVLGERRPFRQILINLFSAAAVRAERGSTIDVCARRDGDLVELAITVPVLSETAAHDAGALSLSLARALLELQDSFLIELTAGISGWRVVTVLSIASQQDFFAPSPARGHPDLAILN
jgi:signal transduction histidine kinase